MGQTVLSINGEDFYINGHKTYTEIDNSHKASHGLLMNARFIQGIFDDQFDASRFNRFGIKQFSPEKNTDMLIQSLKEWYAHGLRAFTVGLQGGGPCFTINNDTIINNPFSEDGLTIDPNYLRRLDKIIRAADKIGMVVLVSYFYPGQVKSLKDKQSIINGVKTASKFIRDQNYTNIIIEICNEYDLSKSQLILSEEAHMVTLIKLAQEVLNGTPVGSSLGGGSYSELVAKASDVVLIHGNGCSRQELYNLILKVKKFAPNKPIMCNEDSQAIGNLKVAGQLHTSWGYYNNLTKQEPPICWNILVGEDQFFAYRMAEWIGLKQPELTEMSQYYFHGFEEEITYDGKRWIRVACLYPETIDYVNFYRNNQLIYTCYDEPFSLFWKSNWLQEGILVHDHHGEWMAEIVLSTGETVCLKQKL